MSEKHKVVVSNWEYGQLIRHDYLFPSLVEATFFGKCHSKTSKVSVYNEFEELVLNLTEEFVETYA